MKLGYMASKCSKFPNFDNSFNSLPSFYPNLISSPSHNSLSYSHPEVRELRRTKGLQEKNKKSMCPLRFILIFLSATLAGFFLLRNLKSHPQHFQADDNSDTHTKDLDSNSSSKVSSGFWMVVDMASGRYLWRHLFSSSEKASN